MTLRPINASSIYPAHPGVSHAVRFDDTVYTSGILPKDKAGNVPGKDDIVSQAELMFSNLEAVLGAAGARMGDVARVNCYIDATASQQLEGLLQIRDKFLKRGTQAGTIAPTPMTEPGALISIEAIAHVNVAKKIVGAERSTPSRLGWADAVRVADTLYVSGQYGHGRTFFEQAKSIYDAFDQIVKAGGATWRDVVRVHQFAIRPDLSIDDIREARSPYMRPENFLSASVVCQPAKLNGIPSPWQLIVDIEATAAPKTYSGTPGIFANPGGLHVVRSGGIGYFSAQMSRDGKGKTLYTDNAEKHADLVCSNLNLMMETAKIKWADIVHARVFCKHPRDVPVVRRVVDRWLKGNACARAELLVDFFDPLATVEIEITASL